MQEEHSFKSLSTSYIFDKAELLRDYTLAVESREVSLLGRKDVFMGRAKFGIFGDGKELAQIALSKVFRKGDFRSGYYRDQTLVAALGGLTWETFFAQLYAHPDLKHDTFSGGRSMNAHFGNAWLNEKGEWLDQTSLYNHVMDVSSTAGQMPRALGLAFASKLYRQNKDLAGYSNFSKNGNEVCFATIGDASTSQGMFFESINAAGVLQIPVIFSVWDDGFGISVPIKYQTTKSSISKVLEGFQSDENGNGLEIIKVKGWDYPALLEAYQKAARHARDHHTPCLVHVYELTQPQGHSASGSHERYKSKERLQWEIDFDCNLRFRNWLLKEGFASESELKEIEETAANRAKEARQNAWEALKKHNDHSIGKATDLLDKVIRQVPSKKTSITALKKGIQGKPHTLIKDALIALRKTQRMLAKLESPIKSEIDKLIENLIAEASHSYSSHLYSETEQSPLKVKPEAPSYEEKPEVLSGYQIINAYFDGLLARDARVFAIGEDIGKIGDVNQGFAGLQNKYGELRIDDTGIRETTIIGQGIGAAMRGLRPIVEVQYFDYIYYCLSVLTDDLASLRYRTFGQQKAPLIVRTRGHRLEGIWHSGSPMAVMINALRGMHIVTPRNFVQASGLYNTLMKGDDPALVIEPLNSYRLKEKMPVNLDTMCIPLGVPEVLREGKDITIVTYGSMCHIVMSAALQLEDYGISVEVIDVQTLLPFDINGLIAESIKKTNRVIFADEDMPGGGAAYMMQEVIEKQKAFFYLDAMPVTISAKEHRPPYGSDGDYFTKPNEDDIFNAAYAIMHEVQPKVFPKI